MDTIERGENIVNSWKRPKINIPKQKVNGLEILLDIHCSLGQSFLIIIWGELPEEVPAHYNAYGVVDRWGSKWELLQLPGVGAFILLLIQTLEKFPEVHNYPQRLNESNAEQFYLNSRKMLNQLKISVYLFLLLSNLKQFQ